jgi:hypothetical protein
MSPAEGDHRWTSENFKYLPGKCWETVVEEIMRVLPAHFLHVIQVFVCISKEDVVVTNFVGLFIVIFGSMVGTQSPFLGINGFVLLTI